MKRIACMFTLMTFLSAPLGVFAQEGVTYDSTSLGIKKPRAGASGWSTMINENYDLIDAMFGEVVATPGAATYENLTTGSLALTSEHLLKVMTNSGAAADVTFTLPECTLTTLGYRYRFRVIATSNEFWVDSHANDTLTPIVDTAGDAVEGPKTLGASLVVECLDMGSSVYNWYADDDGTWEDEDDD